MGHTFQLVLALISRLEIRISDHGYDELAEDDILIREILGGVRDGTVIEDYPEFPKGPCVLVLQKDREGKPIHVVWGIPSHASTPAVLVTAYRPQPARWTEDFTRRIP